MENRKFGYVLDNDRPSRPFLVGIPSRSSLPTRVRVWSPDALDQGDTQSCTGFAAKIMFDGTAYSQGIDFRSSALGAYTVARYGMYPAGDPLQDIGAHFRSLFEMSMRFGVIGEDHCPWEPSRINDDLPFESILQGQSRRLGVGGWYGLDDTGDDRMNSIRAALAKGHPVGGAWRLQKNFVRQKTFSKKNGVLVYQHDFDTSEFAGNHAMAIVGYDEVDGEEMFLVQNSWGKDFGANGLFWAHRDWIDTAWDLTVVRLIP